MKKIIYALMVSLLIPYALAFNFKIDMFGYTISYQPEQKEIIDEVDNMQTLPAYTYVNTDEPLPLAEFNDMVIFLNSYKDTQFILKELGYNRLAFTDTDTNKGYTIVINDEGIITGVYEGYLNPEEYFSGSVKTIKAYVDSGSYMAIRNEITIPFRVKLKLLFSGIF